MLDPVFFIPKRDWFRLLSNTSPTKRYLLLYDFQLNDPEIKKTVLEVARCRNLKIYAIYSIPDYADKVYKNVGPIEFLSLIAKSDFVVSTSFHATAFSVIFEKDFYTFGQKREGNESRMKDFCQTIGLEKRVITTVDEVSPTEKIDYSQVNIRLKSLIRSSCEWLDNSL